MSVAERFKTLLVIAWLTLGIAAPGTASGGQFQLVRGIVSHTYGNVLTIGRSRHDITGIPVLNMDGTASEKGDALRGKLAEILYRNDKIVSVKVSPPMPE